ncbi:TetR/AcrR family transcriptional regulator [Pseudonocardia sp.]|uniref:TetR/AcrR family transcriptional regulator n=1 Tax=Pseudonocardia sp. TaxID=60912 RepID=UPI0031FC6875
MTRSSQSPGNSAGEKSPLTRKEKAEATRRRIIAAAYDSFCSRGYAGTTMKSVAAASAVAVQTIYFVFHSKAELLDATILQAAAGTPDHSPVMQRPWAVEAAETSDARRTIALAVEYGVDIYVRVGPIARIMRVAAMSDTDVDVIWTRIAVNRKKGMRRLVEHLADLGALADGVTVERGTDIFHAVNGHDVYIELVGQAGWPLRDFKRWLYELMIKDLLSDTARQAPGNPLAGLSFA